ncbi:MAG: type II toxin-antitoxin system VapC family toxin [Acidobacteriota bacterium]
MKYLLDTNVCIDYFNGRYPSVRLRLQEHSPSDLCLSSIVVSELRYGADKSSHQRQNHHRIDVLTREIQCLDFDLEAAEVFGRTRSRLEVHGQLIGPYDMLIASHALSRELVVVTDNLAEFSRVEGLEIESWREP